jgi:heptosyltransferase-3
MAGTILVIRGGAIGDFLLTLPALHLFRDALPNCHLEILGYRQILRLAEGRFYAQSTRSIEYAPLAGFFARGGTRTDELVEYFRSFDQIISYLYDPDGLFLRNLAGIGIKDVLAGPGKLDDSAHATEQLARPFQQLGMYLEDPSLKIYPSPEDEAEAIRLLPGKRRRVVLHPGSGGKHKVWPVERWAAVMEECARWDPLREWVIVGGEADDENLVSLRRIMSRFSSSLSVRWLTGVDLPILGAVLRRCGCFLGHDSGISHLAAAAGCRCFLLFGPTDPAIWAPPNAGVRIHQAPGSEINTLSVSNVNRALRAWLEV